MCGIVGYIGSRQSTDVLLDGLSKLEYRGYDSAGVALCVNDEIRVVKAQGRLAVLAEKLNGMPPMASHCGIGHTRWATHGAPSDVNSHPHCAARVSLVHNGIIENYAQLKEHLMKRGYEFCSETDTEVLVKLLDHNYHGEPLDAILRTLEQVRGSYGLAILFKDKLSGQRVGLLQQTLINQRAVFIIGITFVDILDFFGDFHRPTGTCRLMLQMNLQNLVVADVVFIQDWLVPVGGIRYQDVMLP